MQPDRDSKDVSLYCLSPIPIMSANPSQVFVLTPVCSVKAYISGVGSGEGWDDPSFLAFNQK